MINKRLLKHLAALTTIFLWSIGYVLTRIALRYFEPESIAFLRYFVAAATLLIYAFIKKMRVPTIKEIPLFIFGGMVGFAAYVYVFNRGSQTVIVSVSSFIISSAPVITAVLARVFLKEKIGPLGWLAVFCAFSGVGIITVFSGGIDLNGGIAWMCVAALLTSAHNIFQRKVLKKYSPIEMTAYCIIAGAILLGVFSPHAVAQAASAPFEMILVVILLGVFPAGAAYVCWAYALSKAEHTSDITNYMFLTPIVTTFLGVLMIGELPDASAYIGGGAVLLGVLLMNIRHKLKKPKNIEESAVL